MHTRTLAALALAFTVGLGLSVATASPASAVTAAMLARPPGEFPLFLQLNGEATRWVMPDGGQSGIYGSGIQCMPVPPPGATGNGVVLKFQPSAAAFLCVGTLDGGCYSNVLDPNYGDPIAAATNYYVVLRDQTAAICQVPLTGSVNTPVFRMQ